MRAAEHECRYPAFTIAQCRNFAVNPFLAEGAGMGGGKLAGRNASGTAVCLNLALL